MIRSMTGFGAALVAARGLAARTEIRAVNHRHLQAKLRLPVEYGHLEAEIEALLRKSLKRGSVSVHVQLTREGGSAAARLDAEVAAAYRSQLEVLARELGVTPELGLQSYLTLPGVVGGRDPEVDEGQVAKLIQRSVAEALADLVTMREHEGEALQRDLERNSQAVQRTVKLIARRMPTVVRKHHTDLKGRVRELLGDGATLSSSDLAREVALIADRLDVSEELVRLEAHLEQLGKLLAKGGTVGRKLDFMAQEFFREANTIGSKCSDARVAHYVIELKTHIERLREQVQNVE